MFWQFHAIMLPETEKENVEAAAAAIKEESITYNADTTVMNGFVAWDSSSTKRPLL